MRKPVYERRYQRALRRMGEVLGNRSACDPMEFGENFEINKRIAWNELENDGDTNGKRAVALARAEFRYARVCDSYPMGFGRSQEFHTGRAIRALRGAGWAPEHQPAAEKRELSNDAYSCTLARLHLEQAEKTPVRVGLGEQKQRTETRAKKHLAEARDLYAARCRVKGKK